MNAAERHNQLAPAILRQMVAGTLGKGDTAVELLILLESVSFGCIELAAQLAKDEPRGRHAYLDSFVDGLTERIAAAGAGRAA